MKAVCYVEKNTVRVLDMPMPELKEPDDVMVKVEYCAVCGDDRRIVRGGMGAVMPPPYIIGHEMSGRIVALGEKAVLKSFSVGDRVTGNFFKYCGKCSYCAEGNMQVCENAINNTNAMAEYVVWHESELYRIPDNVSSVEACLTEPLTSCMRAVEKSGMKQGSSAAIFGAGGVGLMLTQLAKLRGAGLVVVIEPNAEKREYAVQCGADHVIDPYEQNVYKQAALLTRAKGFDVVIEASGNSEAVRPAFEMLGKCGSLILFAIHDADYYFPLNLSQFYLKDATIHSVYTAPYHFEKALSVIPRLDMSCLTKNVLRYTDAPLAFDRDYMRGKPRIIVRFD